MAMSDERKRQILESTLKRKQKTSFSNVQNKLSLTEFELQIFIIEFMINKIRNFNFKTPHQNNQYLYRCFIYLDSSKDITLIQRKELIEILQKLDREISKILSSVNVGNKESNKSLNKDLLRKLSDETRYTILFLTYDVDHFKSEGELQGKENSLYQFLEYVIFNNDDLHIFKMLVKNIEYSNQKENQNIVNKVLDKFCESLITNNDYDKLFYNEVLGEFLLSSKRYLDKEDIKTVMDKLKRFFLKNQETLHLDGNDLYLEQLSNQKPITNQESFEKIGKKYGIFNGFPYNIEEEIKQLHKPNDTEFTDLTSKQLLSIDNPGVKLRENLFSFDIIVSGYLLTLYVPAITSYVKKDSLMEQVAKERGILVSKSDLFPREFLYDKCSFDQNQDRYAIAYKFYLNRSFDFEKVEAEKVKIRVSKNLDYDDVLELLNYNDDDWVTEQLQYLSGLSMVLSSPRGYNKNYFWVKTINNEIHNRKNRDITDKIGRGIVDNLTIYSNYKMANYFLEKDLPFIYRNNDFNNDLESITDIELIKQIQGSNKEISKILDQLKVDSYFSSENKGHSGLKKGVYCQISAPCRNYASYVCQKLIDLFLIKGTDLSSNERQKLKRQLEEISVHLNNRYKINETCLEEVSKIYSKGD